MKKTTILIVALVVVAIAVTVAVAVDGNEATALPGAFPSLCDSCHGSGAAYFPHTVPAHADIFGTCSNCHSGVDTPGAANVNISNCTTCHGAASAIAQEHAGQTCSDCHQAQTTTTTSSTTTTASSTTTTAPATTTTTAPGTTTTTTAPATTTTTIVFTG